MTIVIVNDQMCEYKCQFNYTKDEFMDNFNNQLAGVGYFIGEDIEGHTIIINPSNCSFIEIFEEARKAS